MHTSATRSSSIFATFFWLLRFLIIILAIGAAIWGWRLIKNPQFMPIQSVKITTTYQHMDQQSLEQILLPYVTGQGLFTVDTSGLKQRLLQIPWIYQVLIQRVWPNTVLINITEQQAVAQWNNTGLLNPQGDLFKPALQTFPQGLPNLNGPEGQEQTMLTQYHAMSTILEPLQLNITELDLNSRQSWQMMLNNGTVVLLGRADIVAKLNRLAMAYTKIFNTSGKIAQTIDLRYPDGLAVSWKTPATSG